MKMTFFEAYFGRADDISNAGVLIKCVESIGLDGVQAREILESDAYAEAVRADEAKYQQAGVSAVPAFIVNQRHLISGAQEPDTLIKAFRDIAAQSPAV